MRIFALQKNFAMSMKVTVIQMMNVKVIFIVDQTIVQLQLGIQLTAVNQKNHVPQIIAKMGFRFTSQQKTQFMIKITMVLVQNIIQCMDTMSYNHIMLMIDHISEKGIGACGGMALVNGGLDIILIEDSHMGMHMSTKMFFVHISCLSWYGLFGVSILMSGIGSLSLEELYS